MRTKTTALPQERTETKPYEATLTRDSNLIIPMIKYGVNPITGAPNGICFSQIPAALIGKLDAPVSTNSIEIGDRRQALINIFANRARLILDNMTAAFLYRLKIDMKDSSFSDLYIKITNRNFYDDYQEGLLFDIRVLSSNGAFLQASPVYYDGGPGRSLSKLIDLEYYMSMPIESVLEVMLSIISGVYTNIISRLDNIAMEHPNRYDTDYTGFKTAISNKMLEYISNAECVIMMLYGEATSEYKPIGVPGSCGIPYDTVRSSEIKGLKNATETAFANNYKEAVEVL